MHSFHSHSSTNRALATFIFLASLLVYTMTMAPTASFWDAGEFIAVAHGLQVNHPPGAPLYSLLGRIFSMFMPSSYVAVSINFISALTSALTVMLLYLIGVRLVREWKGDPDAMATIDKIGMYGGALLGAATFAVTDTFWFSAVEAEVYALSLFFTAMVVWLALIWAENHDKPYNERWLLLIAYLFGLALGVHLLNLLALFFVALIIYFKKYEFQWSSFLSMCAIAVVSFLLIYPFTVQSIPAIMDSITQASYGLIGPMTFIVFVILLISWGLYYTHKNNYRIANIVILCYTMILIGYSSYALIFIRSSADPPIDENDPEKVESFIDYLERKQYGDTPLLTGYTYSNQRGRIDQGNEVFFPRRYSTNPQHVRQYSQYDGDWDYFINYQVNHMYWRYFAWNFIGRDADIQDAGWQSGFTETEHEDNPAHNSYYFIPFLLGLFGMLFHFQNDWKRALSVLALFAFTGLAIIVYLNQTPLQPRERDYAYVGSFFAFAIWIGMGGVGLIELVKDYLHSNKVAAYLILAILLAACPLWMGFQNFHDHDRSERYVARDYAYNLLNSTAPNAILFTNGDNDTFPLWYLQEVEGIRTDVRIVNLSLLNTKWYIKQLKHQWSHESPPLPISFTDEEIEQLAPALHQPDTVSIPVKEKLLKTAFSGSKKYIEAINVPADTSLKIFDDGIRFGIPVDSLDNQISWYYQGHQYGTYRNGDTRYITQVQDQIILNILKNNNWLRPIYFAATVPVRSQLGLQPYFRYEGKAYRIVPDRHRGGNYGWLNTSIFTERLKSFQFQNWDNPDTYLDANIRGMMRNYISSISELANTYIKTGKPDSANYWLEWGKEHLPFKKTSSKNTFPILEYALDFAKVSNKSQALEMVKYVKPDIIEALKNNAEKYSALSAQISQFQREFKNKNFDPSQQKLLRTKAENIKKRQRNIRRDFSRSIINLLIIQRIYYTIGEDKKATQLADMVNNLTQTRIKFPNSEQANKKQIQQIDLL
ncbi:MAG: DUF2723 domain-containing protein [Balneolaceae bacterium]|nr:DUF2723 domain-containing protein [Balneolaceae bacterium]